MTPEKKETERLSFEGHFASFGWTKDAFERDEVGVYKNSGTVTYWLGWLARAALVPYGYATVPLEPTAAQIAAALPVIEQPPSTDDHNTGRHAIALMGPAGEAIGASVAAEMARDYRNLVAAAQLTGRKGH